MGIENELHLLTQAIHAQTEAIHVLVEQNQKMLEILVDVMAEEQEGQPMKDMDGNLI